MNLRPFAGTMPTVGERCWIDPQASVLGDVVLGDDVSVWPQAVIRGDVHHIRIGARTSVQDGAVLHVTHDGPYTPGGRPLLIGREVTIGHKAILHACTVGDACLIGMGSILLDGVVVGEHCMIGAGAVVSPGKQIEPGSLWVGNPARFVRKLSEREIEWLHYSAGNYVRLKDSWRAQGSGPRAQ